MTQPAPLQIPLSQSGPADAFATALEAHRAAHAAHRVGPVGRAAPVAHPWVDALVARVSETGPVALRGPDTFQILPYTIVDDTPRSAEEQQALDVLRETLRA